MKTVLIITSKAFTCSENPLGSYHSLITGLKLNNVKIKTTGNCKLLDSQDEVIKKEDIVSIGKDFNTDLIILMFVDIPETRTCEEFYKEPYLSKSIEIERWEKTIFIDYYERNWRNTQETIQKQPLVHTWLVKKCKKYFKREFEVRWLIKHPNMRPYPLSYFSPNIIPELPEKKYDIFCSFPQQDTGLRKQVINLCAKLQEVLWDDGSPVYNILIKHDCTREEYIKNIQSSWITLDSAGGGNINNRFLEIISNRSLCVRQQYGVQFYKDYPVSSEYGKINFNSAIIDYISIKDLEIKLVSLLEFKDIIKEMEERAYKHYNKYHTADKVVKYLLEESLN